MVSASYISYRCGNISKEELLHIEETLQYFGLPIRVQGYDADEVLKTTKSDKKMVGNKVKFVLLENPGNAYIYKELTDEQILAGIRYLF